MADALKDSHPQTDVAASDIVSSGGFGNPMTDDVLAKRPLDLGRRIPSFHWWFSHHQSLGCSPRDAVDAGRIEEVEALLPNVADQPRPESGEPSTTETK